MLKLSTLIIAIILSLGSLSATTPAEFFDKTNDFFAKSVTTGQIDYAALKASNEIETLVEDIESVDLLNLKGLEREAYLINAYNILVINQVLEHYPLRSVLDVPGFFDKNKITVGGRRLTLNQLEKDLILKEFKDARLHFVLVCGALGCPPITDFAYRPELLDKQLERQTRLAINNSSFLRVNGTKTELSQIFNWYASDFGGNKASVIEFVNKYRESPLPASTSISYYDYDWTLNASQGRSGLNTKPSGISPFTGSNNSARYVVSAAIPQGSFEFKLFNNLYSQEGGGERSSFFTSWLSALYGATDRFNIGFDLRYRRVRYDEAGTASNFDVFGSQGATFSRSAITGFGPKVRIAPFNNLPNFSIQSALWLPVADDPTGVENDGGRFVDFAGPTWFTQIFNDFPIGDNFSFFAEVDALIEDIGSADAGRINRFSTPVTGIFSYFPTPKATLYSLASYSPFWQENFDYFYQLGAGAKYQFTPKFEIEVLATAFDNQFLNSVNGTAGTVNLGLRFNL
ncbi:MAG: DUF547 domain-containing protein [Bacteroidota bacterium]